MSAFRRLLPAIVAVAASVALTVGGPASALAGPSTAEGAHAQGWYLALGDSLAAGHQPGQPDHPRGGYVRHVFQAVTRGEPGTRLLNLACSGETAVSMVDGGVCTYQQGSQLAQAVQFLRGHPSATRLITLDIGANDVDRCVSGGTLNLVCLQAGLADVVRTLPQILAALHAAAPGSRIVVVDYYDPFLAAWLKGASGRSLAVQSVSLLQQLNTIIAGSAAAVGAATADVATAFSTTDFTTQVRLPGVGQVPLNVDRICQWTWMCSKADIHPNDRGYAVIGRTVAAVAGK